MLISRSLSRFSRSVDARSFLLSIPKKFQTSTSSTRFHSLVSKSPIKLVTYDLYLFNHSNVDVSGFQRFGISSSASPEPSLSEHGSAAEINDKESTISSFEGDDDLTMADMIKLVEEKEELLKAKQKEIEQMQDNMLRTLAEMENVMARTNREAENTNKFAIQNFAKGLPDVADNLGRAATHVKGSFSKIDESKDTNGAVPLLKTLLGGVKMTEKQLGEVFRKFVVEKFDPTYEPFDPHKHNAVFQVADNSKRPGTVAHVLKAGYKLHDRVLRPAEVGVTQAPDNDDAA